MKELSKWKWIQATRTVGSGGVGRLVDKHQTTIVLSLTLGEAVGERMATVTEDANGEDMGGARKTCKYHFCICS